MERLSYQVLEQQGYQGFLQKTAPERILQFGEGNFMRAFVDYYIDVLNEKTGFCGKAVLCQPRGTRTASADRINGQDGLYTFYGRGFEKGKQVNEKRVISSVSRCLNPVRDFDAWMECAKNPDLRFITSNTTEAGIIYDPSCELTDRPASSFPGKLTQFLYARFQMFGKQPGKGFVILPCELIEENGRVLERCVLQYARQWDLGEAFERWLQEENRFCSTLVDRIVTGYPAEEAEKLNKENGYEDQAVDTGEVFSFWVIEGPQSLEEELPFRKAGLPVLIVEDHKPYKQRKVRILNGAHSSMVLGAYLAGQRIVRDCMEDSDIRSFMTQAVYEEIIPTLTLPREELVSFADSVMERFCNPFIDHALLDIAMNSTSKWRTRILPSVKDYAKITGKLPACLTASLAFYLEFYSLGCQEDGKSRVSDSQEVLDFFSAHKGDTPMELAEAACQREDFWGEDLRQIEGFATAVGEDLLLLREKGARAVMKTVYEK
ncbi:MAG: tagaturonate reductase [Lachnospiraceae bacterium]|nr:tagaturonate reductase [Lachnospiraceae bacterium]